MILIFNLFVTFMRQALSKQKDRAALLQYMATLDPQSADYIYAESILKTVVSE